MKVKVESGLLVGIGIIGGMELDDVGMAVRMLRRGAGKTQCEVGRMLGVAQGTVTRFEMGRTELHLSMLQKVVEGLGAEVEITIKKRGVA